MADELEEPQDKPGAKGKATAGDDDAPPPEDSRAELDDSGADDDEPDRGRPSRKSRARSGASRDRSRASARKRAEPPPPPPKAAVPLGSVAHLGFVLLAAIGVYSFVTVAKEGELRRRCTPTCLLRPNYAGYERTAPRFTLKDTRGHDVSLESFRGKVVVLNFWTKTCQPCMEEMPEVADLARILKPMNDVALLTISTDETAEDATATLRSVLREEAPFPVLMDPEAKVVRGKFGTSLYPETWIIDKDGVVRVRFDGPREWSSATVVELVDQIRGGGYCPVQARDGRFTGESARLCEGLTGG